MVLVLEYVFTLGRKVQKPLLEKRSWDFTLSQLKSFVLFGQLWQRQASLARAEAVVPSIMQSSPDHGRLLGPQPNTLTAPYYEPPKRS